MLELAKGKSTIKVVEHREIVSSIEAINQAVVAREVDEQLTATKDDVGLKFTK